MMVTTPESIAQLALAQYDVGACESTLIRHSQALAFRVESSDQGVFALRVHHPISSWLSGELLDPAVIRSEMMWLDHLFHETDIRVQEPIRTRSGDWLAAVTDQPAGPEAGPSIHDDNPLYCTLHRWVEEECEDGGALTEDRVRLAAELLAQLHEAAARWRAPDEFRRPRYDMNRMRKALVVVKPLVHKGVIETDDLIRLEKSLDEVERLGTALEDSPAHWGLLHGDFWLANWVVRPDGGISPIDFSECGWGAYVQDVSMALLRLGPFRRLFLEAYQERRALPEPVVRHCEAFVLINFVAWMAFLASVPERHGKLRAAMPWIAHSFCGPFLRGESFLDREDTYTRRPVPEGAGA